MIISKNGKDYLIDIGDEIYYTNRFNYHKLYQSKFKIINCDDYGFDVERCDCTRTYISYEFVDFDDLHRRKTIKNILNIR